MRALQHLLLHFRLLSLLLLSPWLVHALPSQPLHPRQTLNDTVSDLKADPLLQATPPLFPPPSPSPSPSPSTSTSTSTSTAPRQPPTYIGLDLVAYSDPPNNTLCSTPDLLKSYPAVQNNAFTSPAQLPGTHVFTHADPELNRPTLATCFNSTLPHNITCVTNVPHFNPNDFTSPSPSTGAVGQDGDAGGAYLPVNLNFNPSDSSSDDQVGPAQLEWPPYQDCSILGFSTPDCSSESADGAVAPIMAKRMLGSPSSPPIRGEEDNGEVLYAWIWPDLPRGAGTGISSFGFYCRAG